MLAAHAEVPPGVLPTSLLSDHDLRQCNMDPVCIRALENELAEMGLGLGISFGGILRGIGKGVGAVGKAAGKVGGRAFKIARGGVRLAAPVAQFIPGPIGIAATGFSAADSLLRRPGDPAPVNGFSPVGRPFSEATPGGEWGTGVTRYTGPMVNIAAPSKRGRFGMTAAMKRRLAAASAAAGPKGAARAMGWWQHSQTGQIVTGMSQVPPTREPYWKWSATAPRPRAPVARVEPPDGYPPPTRLPWGTMPVDRPERGLTLEERIRGIVGRIAPAIPQVIEFIGGPTPAIPAVEPGAPPWWKPSPAPAAAPSPVVITTPGAPAAAPAAPMPPWLLPAALGVGALVLLPMLTRRAS